MPEYVTTIGLEVHAELKTKTKMFCDSLNDPDEKTPNMNVCPVCMGHPGTLPVANAEAIRKVIQVGMALGCSIEKETFFERKNYFYPDLPKGYQISQFQKPFCRGGTLNANGKDIRIERIHLEEDAGKLMHLPIGKAGEGDVSLADYNRAGVPLLELVTEPDLSEPEQVRAFAGELRLLLRYLEASDADMEKGQMRVEVNLSLRPKGADALGTKVEVKNINSISAATKAAVYEIERQADALNDGQTIIQETRGWDETKQRTVSQRTKGGSADYRYFPEPDLPPVVFTDEQLDEIRASVPELPWQRRDRFKAEYGLPAGDVEVFTVFKELGDYFEEVVSELKAEDDPVSGEAKDYGKLAKTAANWLITHLQPKLTAASATPNDTKLSAERFADFVVRVAAGEVSSTNAQELLHKMWETGDSPEHLIAEHDLAQVSDASSLNVTVEEVIAANEKAAEDFRDGKEAALNMLKGQVMKATKGKANPQVIEELLREKLSG